MKRPISIIAATGAAAAVALGGSAVALAGNGGDDGPGDSEAAISGADLDRASAAALDFTGEGRVSDTEVGDEESYYEVEVTLDNGSQVDVQLDESFKVVSSEGDDESETDD